MMKGKTNIMRINEVNYDYKICEAVINNNPTKSYLWTLDWNKDVPKSYLKDNTSRIYYIVVNDVIYKIGSSSCNGGIRMTLESYRSCGMSGQPSDRTHGVHVLIREELDKGNKVEMYCTLSKQVKITMTEIGRAHV